MSNKTSGASTRPQSAFSVSSKISTMSNDFGDSEFDQSMDEKMMRSSFYSTSSKFGGGSAVTAILDTFSVSNILELTEN